jgi:hypothetical protein
LEISKDTLGSWIVADNFDEANMILEEQVSATVINGELAPLNPNETGSIVHFLDSAIQPIRSENKHSTKTFRKSPT